VGVNDANEATDMGRSLKYYTTIYPKPHAHNMLTKKNIEQGLQLGEKRNDAVLKELRK